MRALLILAACLALGACQTAKTSSTPAAISGAASSVAISPDVSLTFPDLPSFPQAAQFFETLTAYDRGRTRTFQAVVDISPDVADITIIALLGIRLIEIEWDEDGMREKRSRVVPDTLKAQNILADLCLSHWAPETLEAALTPGTIVQDLDGVRTVSRDGKVLVTISEKPGGTDNRRELFLENHSYGYGLRIIRKRIDGQSSSAGE